MARRRITGESRPIIVERMLDDDGDDDFDLDDLCLADEDLLDLDEEDADWDCDGEEAWCDCAPWIDDELCSALWWSVYKNLKKRRRIH